MNFRAGRSGRCSAHPLEGGGGCQHQVPFQDKKKDSMDEVEEKRLR